MRNITLTAICWAACAASAGFGQTDPAAPAARLTTPEFEVASVKVAEPLTTQFSSGKLHVGMKIDGARVDIGSLSLADLLPIAFKVKPYQIAGPAWMQAQRFDVVAKIPDGATTDQVPEMLQALLAGRFKLAFHRENRQNSVYALVIGKGGSKLKAAVAAPGALDPAAPEPAAIATSANAKNTVSIPAPDGSQAHITRQGNGMVVTGLKTGVTRVTPGPDGSMHMEAASMSLDALADALSRFVDRPIVDMTGLKGKYQVSLDLSMADLMKAARGAMASMGGAVPVAQLPIASTSDAAPDPGASSVFESVEHLGLRLEPRKEPVETIVVDHLEKLPTAN